MKEKFKLEEKAREWMRKNNRIKTAFTLNCRKKITNRDVFRMVGKFLNSINKKECNVIVAGDNERCNAFHIGLSLELDKETVVDWFLELNKKLRLGYSKYFIYFGINDANRYLFEHYYYKEKVFN